MISINLYSFYFNGQDALTYYLGDLFGDFKDAVSTKENNSDVKENKENKENKEKRRKFHIQIKILKMELLKLLLI